MNFLLLVCLVLVFCFVNIEEVLAKKHDKHHHHSKLKHHKIVGGSDADIKDYKYQAFLLLEKQPEDYYQCGGSIINTRYILSAAHCFPDVTSVKARIGSTNRFSGGKEYSGTWKTHPKYEHISKDYDMSLVKTDDEMELDGTYAQAVSIFDGSSIPSGSILKLSGWGAISEGGPTSDTLRAVEVPSLSNDECNKKEKITLRQFCGGYDEGGKDTCQGDSGGPVVLSDSGLLAGIVSAGYGCARPNQPGIYTNLTDTDIRNWVTQEAGV